MGSYFEIRRSVEGLLRPCISADGELLGGSVWVSEVFSGVESGVWVWGLVVWCVPLRGLRWTVMFG